MTTKSDNSRVNAPINELLRRAKEQQIEEEQYQAEYYEEEYPLDEDEWDGCEDEEREYDPSEDDGYQDEYEDEELEESEGEEDGEIDYEEEDYLDDEEIEWSSEDELEDNSKTDTEAKKQSTSKASAIFYNLQQDEQWAGLFALPRHRWAFILFTAILVIIAASWNTKYNTQLRTLTHKEEQLKDLRYRTLYTTAELVRLERINSIEERISELKLPLEHSSQPPYQIVDTLNTKP